MKTRGKQIEKGSSLAAEREMKSCKAGISSLSRSVLKSEPRCILRLCAGGIPFIHRELAERDFGQVETAGIRHA